MWKVMEKVMQNRESYEVSSFFLMSYDVTFDFKHFFIFLFQVLTRSGAQQAAIKKKATLKNSSTQPAATEMPSQSSFNRTPIKRKQPSTTRIRKSLRNKEASKRRKSTTTNTRFQVNSTNFDRHTACIFPPVFSSSVCLLLPCKNQNLLVSWALDSIYGVCKLDTQLVIKNCILCQYYIQAICKNSII